MIRNITKIGNSQGIIIPNDIIQKMGNPEVVELTMTNEGIIIKACFRDSISRKPRNRDEINGFYELMKSNIENNIKKGKVKWIGEREMEVNL